MKSQNNSGSIVQSIKNLITPSVPPKSTKMERIQNHQPSWMYRNE